MTTITPDDIVMATATFRGRTIATIHSTGFTGLNDVLRAIRYAAGSLVGLLELSLRNASRGWSESRSLFLAPLRPGTQLTLL